ncbi:uncharacterized protein LOC123561038 isoform X1 [Mercenaria mercenaria]|uniref:uncharacterized protein LOC123561038 isoform X1 n=1 Tax=Mercenaria mercenaria TaxID=6596 RepID=UPI00234F3459|nr:uncharacterized protein LOC123561038 isoform X1 [Mercenaria mercenaria]
MGPKQQPKKSLDSPRNIGGSLTKKRKSSDNEYITEDDQDYQDDQEDHQEEEITDNLSQKTNAPSTSKRHRTGNYEDRRAQPLEREAVTVDDIAGPKTKKKVPPKSLTLQIFTSVLMYQLLITITCVILVNYCSVSILSNSVPTTVQDGEQKLKAMDTELEKLKKAVSDTKRLYEEYKHKVLQLDDIRSRIDVMQQNMFNKDSFKMAFMILIVMVFVLAVSVYNLYQRSNNDIPVRTGGRTTAKQRNNLGNNEVLRMIPGGAELEAGVCIISFDESRTATHRRILDSANVPNCRVQVHVIRKHEHIPELPRCKVYLMCTEFSERHVIIEEPGKGLGDLHRTTYDAVMKLGGCLIILYTRDPGSRNLKDQVQYNKNIYCVANQPELSDLNQDGRFFSLYDNLSHYQKSELRRKITENMT